MRPLQVIIFTILLITGLAVSFCYPSFLGEHLFLNGYIETGMVPVTAVLVTVTLVIVLQIHSRFTRLEQAYGVKGAFDEPRAIVTRSAIVLIYFLAASFVILLIHPFAGYHEVVRSIVNLFAIILFVECLFFMYDLIHTGIVLGKEWLPKEPLPKEQPTK